MGKTIYIDDGDALNIDRVIVNMPNTKWCKVLYSCDLIDEYEDRLKADMADMLTELKTEIEEKYNEIPIDYSHPERIRAYTDILGFIQQKIDMLKENEDGNK